MTRNEKISATLRRRFGDRPGLQQMRASTPPGLCPFCLDPIPPSTGRPFTFCGDPECKTAYFRCWRRDERHPPQVQHVIPYAQTARAMRRAAMSRGHAARWGTA